MLTSVKTQKKKNINKVLNYIFVSVMNIIIITRKEEEKKSNRCSISKKEQAQKRK